MFAFNSCSSLEPLNLTSMAHKAARLIFRVQDYNEVKFPCRVKWPTALKELIVKLRNKRFRVERSSHKVHDYEEGVIFFKRK